MERPLGNLSYTFATGISIVAFTQNFDGVVAPALPAGWTSTATGIEVPWVTSTTTPVSAPNDAFAPDPSNVGDTVLVTPGFPGSGWRSEPVVQDPIRYGVDL